MLAFGHTHALWARDYGGVYFVNVGSVGRPKDGDPRAAYTLLHLDPASAAEAETVRVDYDAAAVADGVRAVGLPEALAMAVRRGR